MKSQIISALCVAAFAAAAQTVVNVIPPQDAAGQKVTVEVESTSAASREAPPRKVALVVQNHAEPGARIPMMALTDAMTARLSDCGFQVINPYNSVGVNQNRTVVGEKTPQVSAMGLARQLKADGVVTASVIEFLDSVFGTPPILHQYSVRISFNLADAQTGAAICGETVKVKSPKYTNNQVAQNKQEYLGDLLHSAANECAARLKANPNVAKWEPMPPPPPPPPPVNPNLTISDIDAAVQKLFAQIRVNPVFRSNYDKAQGEIGKAPLAIIGGLVDMTNGKSPCGDLADLLAAGAQTVRMTFINSGLFEAKDDALVTTITKRIISTGNSPLEDGELMSALKQHGSPDFFVVGDMMYFVDAKKGKYRLRLALHDMHTGKIVLEDVYTIEKPLVKQGGRHE